MNESIKGLTSLINFLSQRINHSSSLYYILLYKSTNIHFTNDK